MALAPEQYNVIVRPLLTEKSSNAQADNVYTFQIAPKVNKIQVRQAVESIWNVKVKAVRTMNCKGEERRNRFGRFKTKTKRKAYVTLKEGYSIEIA